MGKGVLKITKTAKNKIIVHLDRLNGRPPVPLSYVSFPDDTLNDQPCDYVADNTGRITSIMVDGKVVFGRNFDVLPPPPANDSQSTRQGSDNTPRRITDSPVHRYADSLNLRLSKLPVGIRNLGIQDIDNFSLKFNKAARFETDGAKKDSFVFFRNDYRKRKDGSESGAQYFIKANYGNLDFKGIALRQSNAARERFGAHCCTLQFAPDWRLICGLSGGIYETNMNLHHVYGAPCIPASSIKGVVRSWIIVNVFANAPAEEGDYPLVNAEYRALKTNQLFCDVFGSPESIERVLFSEKKPKMQKEKYQTTKEVSAAGKEKQGDVVFMEGLPVQPPEIMPDIMNPHYPDWYGGKSLPTDFQNPNPIVFLTVSNHSRFQTCIGVSAAKNARLSDKWPHDYAVLANPVGLDGQATLLELVEAWVKKALSEHGIGAKTASGYGILV